MCVKLAPRCIKSFALGCRCSNCFVAFWIGIESEHPRQALKVGDVGIGYPHRRQEKASVRTTV